MPVYFDIETLDFFKDPHIAKIKNHNEQLAAIRFGLAVTYDSRSDEWRSWLPADLPKLWTYLVQADTIVGWNIDEFDIPVLKANYQRAGGKIKRHEVLRTVDLFTQIREYSGRWYKLDVAAEANLGRRKSADGQQAATWLKAGDTESLRKVEAYCREDVKILAALHAILEQGEGLHLPARSERGEKEDLYYTLGAAPLPRTSKPRSRSEPIGTINVVLDASDLKPPKRKFHQTWWGRVLIGIGLLFACGILSNLFPPAG